MFSKYGVYPRVGGATRPMRTKPKTRTGLSPRGRGNLLSRVPVVGEYRSIPAWAGQPTPLKERKYGSRVYPRVGGATSRIAVDYVRDIGLSPRGRGNRYFNKRYAPPVRSIPAWAGQPPWHKYPLN